MDWWTGHAQLRLFPSRDLGLHDHHLPGASLADGRDV